MLHKWLNRRGGKRSWTWEKITKLTEEWIVLERPRIYHRYKLAKPQIRGTVCKKDARANLKEAGGKFSARRTET
jgi:hypothetical protein